MAAISNGVKLSLSLTLSLALTCVILFYAILFRICSFAAAAGVAGLKSFCGQFI